MTARRGPAAYLRLRVGSRHEVAFVPFPAKAPMFVIGAASTLVTFTLPEHLDAGHVDFARSKVYELMRTGQLRSVKLGGSRRVSTKALAEFVARLEADAA